MTDLEHQRIRRAMRRQTVHFCLLVGIIFACFVVTVLLLIF